MATAHAPLDVGALNERFDGAEPARILAWAWDTFAPDVMLTCSFQHDGVVLAHMLQQIAPEAPVVFINTGFHFPETLAYRDRIVRDLPIANFVELEPVMERAEFARTHGLDLYDRDPDLCCQINKIEPLRRHLPGVRAWINGRRREQSTSRQHIPVLELYRDGLCKVNPLATWTSREIYYYMEQHRIPPHPLFERGYASIGCAPCTRPVLAGEDDRSGRWAGREKSECGIHTFLERKA